MHWQTALILLIPLACRAEDAPRGTAEWIAELGQAYAKVGGYIATYRTQKENINIEAVLGLDKSSGLCAVHFNAEINGQKLDGRQWNTRGGEIFYVENGGTLLKISGIKEEMGNLAELRKEMESRLTGTKLLEIGQFSPTFSLGSAGLQSGLYTSSKAKPAWMSQVERGKVSSFDEKSVTFEAPDLGELTVSREHGLVTRQTVTGTSGKRHTLELSALQMNPGDKAVEELSAQIETADAQPTGAALIMIGARKQVFREIVSMIESGRASLAKLEEILDAEKDTLRKFTAACISDTMGIGAGPETKVLLDQVKEHLREKWKKDTPENLQTEKGFEIFLTSPEVRCEVRDALAESVLRNDKIAPKKAIHELFGRRDEGDLQAYNEAGEAAWELIDKAVARAYFEALIERKMTQHWGEREGLE